MAFEPWLAISMVNKAVSNLTGGWVCVRVRSRLMPHIFTYVLVALHGLPPRPAREVLVQCPGPPLGPHPVIQLACQAPIGSRGMPGKEAGQGERGQVRGQEGRRSSRRHPVPALGPGIGFVSTQMWPRGTFQRPCPRGCSMLLLVSLQWDSATGANRRWLQQ